MFKKLILTAIISLLSSGFQVKSCQSQDEEMIRMGSDVKTSLVIFFKKETSSDEIYKFVTTVIANSEPNGTGNTSLPAIVSVVRIIVNDFQGQAIEFKANATDEQKSFVKKRVLESPIVYKVYENVVPDEIKDLK
jgi:hypothetical protein